MQYLKHEYLYANKRGIKHTIAWILIYYYTTRIITSFGDPELSCWSFIFHSDPRDESQQILRNGLDFRAHSGTFPMGIPEEYWFIEVFVAKAVRESSRPKEFDMI